MKTIQIRNVPEDVHATLCAGAAGAGVSLSDYALAELERLTERPAVSDVLRRARTRAGGTTTPDIVAAVRAGRDRDPSSCWLLTPGGAGRARRPRV